jgi:uncharacterized iron-regulated protein
MRPLFSLLHPAGLRLALLLCAALICGACAGKQVGPRPEGQLVSPDGKAADVKHFLGLAADADYVLIGERHDSALDHRMQASLLADLAESGKKPLLGLEMLPRYRYDTTLADFRQGRIPLEELPRALDWGKTWGFGFGLYMPVFATARNLGVPLFGLNIANDLRLKVSHEGLAALSPKQKAELPAEIVPPLPEQRDKLALFFRAHQSMLAEAKAAKTPASANMPKARGAAKPPMASAPMPPGVAEAAPMSPETQNAFDRFLLIQSLWDSVMAEQARILLRSPEMRERGRGPMVILAGGGHVEYGYGIAHRLKVAEPEARVLLVMPFSDALPDPKQADFFYYSPYDPAAAASRSRIGIRLEPEGDHLVIVEVLPGSRADKAGLRKGDIPRRAGGFVVQSVADLHRAAMEAKEAQRRLSIAVEREGRFLAVYVPDAGAE